MKKVIRIRTGLFISNVYMNHLQVVDTITEAMDVSDWTYERLSFVMKALIKMGYKPEIINKK